MKKNTTTGLLTTPQIAPIKKNIPCGNYVVMEKLTELTPL